MNARVQATLDELERTRWFHTVGQQDTKAAFILTSWNEAVISCNSSEWNDLLLEAANRYRSQLLHLSKTRFTEWNDVIRDLKRYTEPLATRKMNEAISDPDILHEIESTVRWDLLHLAAEAEFADVCPPGFYASQAYWYVKGHFPCGWKGDFPEGKLIVF